MDLKPLTDVAAKACSSLWKGMLLPAGAVIVTLAVIGILAVVVHRMGERKAAGWAATIDVQPCSPKTVLADNSANPRAVIEPYIRARLSTQLDEVCARSTYHLAVMRDFYVNYFYALTMALLLGATAAVLLFFISRVGWGDAAAWHVPCFIIVTAAGAVFGALPLLYSQQDNIDQNKELYLYHRALRNEILSFTATSEPFDRRLVIADESRQPTGVEFIGYVDRRMTDLNRLPLGFDYKRLPADYLAGIPEQLRAEGSGQQQQNQNPAPKPAIPPKQAIAKASQ